jgi:hypothetical protein
MMQTLLWLGLSCLALYELLAITRAVKVTTLSELVWALATCRPIVPFIAGLVAGHLFWQR